MNKRIQFISLTLWVVIILGLYSWRVLLPAARTNYALPIFYTAAYVQRHTPAQMSQLYNDTWLNEQAVHLGFPFTGDMYRPNPPTLALFFLPLLLVPVSWAPFVWAGLNLLALVAGLVVLMAALGLPRRWGLWFFPLVALSQPVLHHFARGQLYLPVFLGLSISFYGFAHRRDRVTGLGLGLILVAKTAGAWIFLLFLLTRRWRLVGWTVITAVPFILLSLICSGLSPWLTYISALSKQMSNPSRVVTAYQTISSLFGHLFTFDTVWNPTPIVDLPWLAVVLIALTFGSALMFSWYWGRGEDDQPEKRLLVLAMFAALAVTNAPLAEDYHFVLLLPSLITAVWWAARVQQGQSILIVVILLLALPLPFKNALLTQSWLALFAYPRVYGAYLLWGWLLWQVRQHSTGVQLLQQP